MGSPQRQGTVAAGGPGRSRGWKANAVVAAGGAGRQTGAAGTAGRSSRRRAAAAMAMWEELLADVCSGDVAEDAALAASLGPRGECWR